MRLISITKFVLQVTHNGSTICMQISIHLQRLAIRVCCVKQLQPVLFCLKLLKAEMEKCVIRIAAIIRPKKGEQKHILYKNTN